jgi:DNA-binding beta-propeller fold protein YncE
MKPFGIAVGETDAIIVSDIHSHCVKVLARSGKVMDTIVGPQSPQQIYSPVCLTTDRESQLYILDKEGKKSIYRFKNGNFDTTFTNKVNKSYKLSQSWGMAVTDDLIYVTDWQKSCIHIFQTSGKYKDTLSCGQQSEKAVMKHPVGIAVMPDGSLVVADHDSHCVWKVVHTKDIVEFQQIGSENILHSPYGVAVTREGYIVVTDTGTSQVCLFSPTGTFITFLGKKGSEKGEFNLPRHVCTTPGGEILVADEGNQRIQVFELCHGS